jgi:hypothetical protein
MRIVVQRILDDGCAVVRPYGETSHALAEGSVGELSRSAAVILPRVINKPIALIQRRWPAIVGDDLARFVQPVGITGVALVVKAVDSSYAHQCSFLEREIVEGVNSLHVAAIERIRFRMGSLVA